MDDAARKLNDLRRSQPADATLKNLLGILSTKLDLCSRLPVFEWEAANDGQPRCAAMFRRLAEQERASCAEVLDSLQRYLEGRTPETDEGRS